MTTKWVKPSQPHAIRGGLPLPDPLASMERDVEIVGAVLEVTYTTDAGRTGSPPPDMVRAQFLTEGYSTVSVRISLTGVYTVVVT